MRTSKAATTTRVETIPLALTSGMFDLVNKHCVNQRPWLWPKEKIRLR
jgi:hypothetical protein